MLLSSVPMTRRAGASAPRAGSWQDRSSSARRSSCRLPGWLGVAAIQHATAMPCTGPSFRPLHALGGARPCSAAAAGADTSQRGAGGQDHLVLRVRARGLALQLVPLLVSLHALVRLHASNGSACRSRCARASGDWPAPRTRLPAEGRAAGRVLVERQGAQAGCRPELCRAAGLVHLEAEGCPGACLPLTGLLMPGQP